MRTPLGWYRRMREAMQRMDEADAFVARMAPQFAARLNAQEAADALRGVRSAPLPVPPVKGRAPCAPWSTRMGEPMETALRPFVLAEQERQRNEFAASLRRMRADSIREANTNDAIPTPPPGAR